jgi:hypothetical protein
MSKKKGGKNKGSKPNTDNGDSKPKETYAFVIPVNQG